MAGIVGVITVAIFWNDLVELLSEGGIAIHLITHYYCSLLLSSPVCLAERRNDQMLWTNDSSLLYSISLQKVYRREKDTVAFILPSPSHVLRALPLFLTLLCIHVWKDKFTTNTPPLNIYIANLIFPHPGAGGAGGVLLGSLHLPRPERGQPHRHPFQVKFTQLSIILTKAYWKAGQPHVKVLTSKKCSLKCF